MLNPDSKIWAKSNIKQLTIVLILSVLLKKNNNTVIIWI